MINKYKHVFSPVEIRGVYYKNRIELAPPGCACAADERGFVTPYFVNYFKQFAKNGVCIVTVGNASIDRSECYDEDGQLDMISDECIEPLSTFADMCNSYGALGQLEINHNGATQGNHRTATPGQDRFSASEIITEAERVRAFMQNRAPIPTIAMSHEKIDETIEKYANAALRAKKAGMKSVMLHGAHTNLLAQFFSPYFNKRRDEYGGSIHNRARFAVEVIDAVRAAVGEDFTIEYRISGEEFAQGHTHFAENMQFIDIIKDKIDILHVSGGIHDTQGEPWVMRPMIQPYLWPHMYNVHWAADIKQAFPDLYVCTVGSIMNIQNAEDIIASGKADFVGYTRELIADPEMVRKYAEGREEDHRPCLRCSCVYNNKHGILTYPCSVNPYYCKFDQYPDAKVPQANAKKKVAVIGGGPAGVVAMMTLVERGHDVTLYEKTDTIGGTLLKAAQLPFKIDVKNYVQYLQNQVKKTSARVLMETEATPELLMDEHYDVILVAVGAEPSFPDVPGVEGKNVYWAPDAEIGVELGERVAIVGAGTVGVECLYHLLKEGGNRRYIVLQRRATHRLTGSVSSGLGGLYDLEEALQNPKVDVHYNSKLTAISDGKLSYQDVITGEEFEIEVDSVLLATGMKPLTKLANSFRECCPATNVFLIGDCAEVGEVREAVKGAFAIASEI